MLKIDVIGVETWGPTPTRPDVREGARLHCLQQIREGRGVGAEAVARRVETHIAARVSRWLQEAGGVVVTILVTQFEMRRYGKNEEMHILDVSVAAASADQKTAGK